MTSHVAASGVRKPRHLALERQAEVVTCELQAQQHLWDNGFTRRRFLAGAGMVGVAAFASQLVTTKVAFGKTSANAVVVVFLRGGTDGLRVLVPASSALGADYLKKVRPGLLPADSTLLPFKAASGWALNGVMKPLVDAHADKLAFIPAASAANISRSHFEAQALLEAGGNTAYSTGWLDRTLTQLGAGTTFRAMAFGSAAPASLTGPAPELAINGLGSFKFPGYEGVAAQSEAALHTLYRGLDNVLGGEVPETLNAINTAAAVAKTEGTPMNGAKYPDGDFGRSLKDLAALIRKNVGVEVATLDVGGWDTHTGEAGDLDRALTGTAAGLAAFMTDLGPELAAKTTVVVMTEFGRRVEQNGSGGTDHGTGQAMWLVGGGVKPGVFGKWDALSDATLTQGDVPAKNMAFDVLGEVIQKRLGVGSLSKIFPGFKQTPVGAVSATG
jgi:uncharacterized protein (DUF1501 family)